VATRSTHVGMVTIPSTRFDTLEVADEAVIHFPLGLIGLPGKHYARVARPGVNSHFGWLHSVEHAHVAIPVTNPFRWFVSFAIALSDEDLSRVGAIDPGTSEIHAAVRLDGRSGGLAANLRAPIVIVGSVGHQVINHARGASLQAPLPAALRAA